MDSFTDSGILPIEIRLLWGEQGEKVLLGVCIVSPGTVGIPENLAPIIWWLWLAFFVKLWFLPDVPVSF
jgi:hypothetical protein